MGRHNDEITTVVLGIQAYHDRIARMLERGFSAKQH
jgi:hypothetical protein